MRNIAVILLKRGFKRAAKGLKVNRSHLGKALLHKWVREMLQFSVAIIRVGLKYSTNVD